MSKQDPNAVYNIIAFIFADRKTAKQVSGELKSSAWIQNYKVIADAVVEMDEKGKAHIHQDGHGGIGATGGGGGTSKPSARSRAERFASQLAQQ